MSAERERRARRLRQIMDDEGPAIYANVTEFNEGRYETVAELDDYQDLRDEVRSIKEDAIARLPELIDQLTEAIESQGGHVYIADDQEEAQTYIQQIATDHDAETMVKSKSVTSEEIEMNEAVEEAGVDIWETDLGDFVIQIAEEEPSHLVGPALHWTRDEIADLFNEHFDPDEPLETAEELTMFAREFLGERMKEADIGMTGANFLTADTGTAAVITSEGNARKVVQGTDVHIAVTGIEKVLPTFDDLAPFLQLLARSTTGQDMTAYVNLFTPSNQSPTFGDGSLSESDDDREFHLVLIDNGRMEMREDEHLRETLYCIRCGACHNVCANFQQVGGHAWGGETYTGGIGAGWEAGVHGLQSASEFNDLCTGCNRCTTACPVKIDIPWINDVVRDRLNHEGEESDFDFLVEGLVPDEEPGTLDIQKRLFGNFDVLGKLGSTFAPLSNWATDLGPVRTVMEETVGVDKRRKMPTFSRETFVDWFESRGGTTVTDPDREVVLYPDMYTNYMVVERGKATVRALEALGVAVRLSEPVDSGRPSLSQGMIETATKKARNTYHELVQYIDDGLDVVVIEPTDAAMFQQDYENLLDESSFERLAEHSFEIMEYIDRLSEAGVDITTLQGPTGTDEIAYHSNCQQRSIGLEPETLSVLETLGYDVAQTDVECCGMAGSFGYKEQYYEVSMEVGEVVEGQLTSQEMRNREVFASGMSCHSQIDSLLERTPRHPIELIAPAR
ncbi:MAG: LUD domain-containing protein [Halodesulfurarchaeum sp.]